MATMPVPVTDKMLLIQAFKGRSSVSLVTIAKRKQDLTKEVDK